ncbi:MAG: TrmB family transcriptional regulator, partial [Candidatus Thorarchaeota archaeon]
TKSNVPAGRIYEVLSNLRTKGLVDIIDSKPKKFKALTLNTSLYHLITHQTNEYKRKIDFLYNQLKILESKFYNSNLSNKQEFLRTFWSTTFDKYSTGSMYLKHIKESKQELLMLYFIDENTIKILHTTKNAFKGIRNAVDRGVNIKIIWSFEYDKRPLSEEKKIENITIYKKLVAKLEELFDLSTQIHNFEMKFIHKKIPIYYDIFDRKRIIIKFQNPSNPWQISTCISVLDPNLANQLREKFDNIWVFETSN